MGILRKPPKKKRNRGLTRQQQREREEKIRELIGQGYDFDDIKEITGFQPHILRYYFQRILEKDRAMFESMTPESVFSGYVIKTTELIRQLDEYLVLFEKHNQLAAYVQALKQQVRISNGIIKMAYQLGLISRRTRQVEINGYVFTKMSRSDVRNHLAQRVQTLSA